MMVIIRVMLSFITRNLFISGNKLFLNFSRSPLYIVWPIELSVFVETRLHLQKWKITTLINILLYNHDINIFHCLKHKIKVVVLLKAPITIQTRRPYLVYSSIRLIRQNSYAYHHTGRMVACKHHCCTCKWQGLGKCLEV